MVPELETTWYNQNEVQSLHGKVTGNPNNYLIFVCVSRNKVPRCQVNQIITCRRNRKNSKFESLTKSRKPDYEIPLSHRYDAKGGESSAETSMIVPATGTQKPAVRAWTNQVEPETYISPYPCWLKLKTTGEDF